jgi:transcriptional regulator with XRE-family HTH domain
MNTNRDVSTVEPGGVGPLLRRWREARHLSQLELSLEAEVSARHLSFLESGRAEPSREMVLRLAQVLDVPLRERNFLLLAAGYAPIYGETSLEDPRMSQMRAAIEIMLRIQRAAQRDRARPPLECRDGERGVRQFCQADTRRAARRAGSANGDNAAAGESAASGFRSERFPAHHRELGGDREVDAERGVSAARVGAG